MNRASFIVFTATNKWKINIIKVYITTMYNLYFYMFRHFHVIYRQYYICASLKLNKFSKIAAFEIISQYPDISHCYISSWIMAVEIVYIILLIF